LQEDRRVVANAASETLLEPITAFEVDSEGFLYVLQPRAAVVEVFSPDGRFQRRIARRGSGPGELRQPVQLGLLRDTLWVIDGGTRRASLFRRDGRFIGTRSAIAATSRGTVSALAELLIPGGRAITRTVPTAGTPGRAPRDFGAVVLLDSGGAVVDTVALLPKQAPAIRVKASMAGTTAQLSAPQPFADKLLFAWSERDRTILVVHSIAPTRALGATYLVEKRRGSSMVLSRRIGVQPVAVSSSLVAAALARLSAPPVPDGMKVELRVDDIKRQLVTPPFLPPVEDVAVATDGSIWVREASQATERTRYRILDPSGTAIAAADLPGELVSIRVGRTHVWALLRSEDGEEALVSYRRDGVKG
jgi:hypothetical protein